MLVRSVVLTAAVAALSGCSSISSTLGLERHIPDESQVTVRPALTLPPDFDLKPPGTETAVSADHEQANPNAVAESGATPVAAKKPEDERGFFGKLFHGDFFGNDVDATTAKPPEGEKVAAPDVNGTPQAPAPDKPAADAAPPAAAPPPPAADVNGTPQAPATK
jgi:hypothetical protein